MNARAPHSASSRRKLVLLYTSEHPRLTAEAQRLKPFIERHAEVALIDMGSGEDLAAREFDLAVVVGGDGSMLRAVHQMGRRQRPVLGVNLGKLGFLADLLPDEFVAQLPEICSAPISAAANLMYECSIIRQGQRIEERLGLNEVSVLAGPPFKVLDIDLYVDSELVTTYSCDGLIVSTPVGSTAHSLSAGGPILRQDLQAFVIMPISPHTLTNRPVIDSAQRIYELGIPAPNVGTTIVADGRVICQAQPGDRVRIERSEAQFQLVAVAGHSYYGTLREKLGWSGRLR